MHLSPGAIIYCFLKGCIRLALLSPGSLCVVNFLLGPPPLGSQRQGCPSIHPEPTSHPLCVALHPATCLPCASLHGPLPSWRPRAALPHFHVQDKRQYHHEDPTAPAWPWLPLSTQDTCLLLPPLHQHWNFVRAAALVCSWLYLRLPSTMPGTEQTSRESMLASAAGEISFISSGNQRTFGPLDRWEY